MNGFNDWLKKQGHVTTSQEVDIFEMAIPKNAPELISMWIMDEWVSHLVSLLEF
jgi:hypothetical protein